MIKRWLMIALLALLIGVNAGFAQEATESPTQEISPALTAQMAQLEQITQNLRHLTAKNEIEHKFPTRQETIDYLAASYDREFPPEKFEQLKQFYVALDLLPADIDLHDVYLGLLDSQVAGFYDPDTKTMNVIPVVGNSVGDSLSPTEQIIYVHEFTHALQDQYFDLNKLDTPDVEAVPDRSLALTSLIEGDATATMTLFSQELAAQNPLAALSMLVEGAQAGNLTLPTGIPQVLVDELLFPYDGGLDFILALYKQGGYDAINAAFEKPPTTTEQILHPDKYIAGEGAEEVALPDESDRLGDGWTDVWDTTLGEYYLREHLETQLSDADASKAAAGWGGDHFRVYQNGDQIASELRLAWDSFTDSQEFHDAYVEYGDKRFGGDADADGCWHDDTTALCLVNATAGPESLIVSAPTVEQALALAGQTATA